MGLGVDRFGTDSGKHAKLSGKRTDDIIRCIDRNADNGDVLFAVRDSHSAYDIFGIQRQKMVEFFDRILIFYDNADQGNACVHVVPHFPVTGSVLLLLSPTDMPVKMLRDFMHFRTGVAPVSGGLHKKTCAPGAGEEKGNKKRFPVEFL